MQYIYFLDYATPSIGCISVESDTDITTEQAEEILKFKGYKPSDVSYLITDDKLYDDTETGVYQVNSKS